MNKKLTKAQRSALQLLVGGRMIVNAGHYVMVYDPEVDRNVIGGNFGLPTFAVLHSRGLIAERPRPDYAVHGYAVGSATYWQITETGRAVLKGGK